MSPEYATSYSEVFWARDQVMNYPSLSLSQASIENIFATESRKEQFQSDDTATRTYKPNIRRVLSNTKYRDYLCIDSNEDKAFQKHSTLKEKFANKSLLISAVHGLMAE